MIADTGPGAPASPGTPGHRSSAAPWFIAEGGLLLVLGLGAAVLPGLAGIAGALVFGWLLIISGVFGLASLAASRAHTHVIFAAISALIAVGVGLLIIWQPLVGAVTLAIFLAAYLLIDGVAMIGMALDQRKRSGRGWQWLLIAGVVDILLGLLILFLRPWAETVVLGYLIAIDLAVAGIALITLGVHARRA
jgi:uncharacterized membrane protein HdeD (DUF308 family)